MFAVSWAFLTLAIALVYRILPDAKIAWRDVSVGAGSSGFLFLLGNHLIGWQLAAAGITWVYGAAGSIVTVLLWVYYSSQVVLFGAAFTRVYARQRGRLWNRKKTRCAHPKEVCLTDSPIQRAIITFACLLRLAAYNNCS